MWMTNHRRNIVTIKRSSIGFMLIWFALIIVAGTADTESWRWAWWIGASFLLSLGLNMYVTGKIKEQRP
jgi:hypothetical protein